MTDRVAPIDRPPVRLEIPVKTDAATCFRVFTERLGEWWPTATFALAPGRVTKVDLDGRVGGVVVETRTDGTTAEWGRVVVWEPPHRFGMTWNQTGTPTEVHLEFRSQDDGSTVVELEHRGWERLSTDELARACALPGGYLGGAFRSGWEKILEQFRRTASDPRPQEQSR
jgi:hypothetical protein